MSCVMTIRSHAWQGDDGRCRQFAALLVSYLAFPVGQEDSCFWLPDTLRLASSLAAAIARAQTRVLLTMPNAFLCSNRSPSHWPCAVCLIFRLLVAMAKLKAKYRCLPLLVAGCLLAGLYDRVLVGPAGRRGLSYDIMGHPDSVGRAAWAQMSPFAIGLAEPGDVPAGIPLGDHYLT